MYDLNVLKAEKVINKSKVIFTIVLACFLIFSILTSIAATAAVDYTNGIYTVAGETFDESGNRINAIKRFAWKLIYYTYGGMFSDLANTGAFSIDDYQPGGSNGVWSVFWTCYDEVSVVGYALILLFALMELFEQTAMGNFSVETFIKVTAKMAAAVVVISVAKDAITACIGYGNELMSAVSGAIGGTEGAAGGATGGATGGAVEYSGLDIEAKNLFQDVKDGGIFHSAGVILQMVIPAFTMLACFIIALVQLIGRILELGVRVAFAPIGIADLAAHGTHSAGARYLKSVAGCACQGVAMYMVLTAGVALMDPTTFTNMFGNSGNGLLDFLTSGGPITQILVGITIVGVMKRVDSIIRDAF